MFYRLILPALVLCCILSGCKKDKDVVPSKADEQFLTGTFYGMAFEEHNASHNPDPQYSGKDTVESEFTTTWINDTTLSLVWMYSLDDAPHTIVKDEDDGTKIAYYGTLKGNLNGYIRLYYYRDNKTVRIYVFRDRTPILYHYDIEGTKQ